MLCWGMVKDKREAHKPDASQHRINKQEATYMDDKNITADDVPVIIKAFKGFENNMQCRGYQFEVGKTYAHEGAVKACSSGFHSCEYPLDVFRYYAPANSVFAEVEARGQISRHDEDSKIASSSLTLIASMDLPEIINKAIEYTISKTNPAEGSSNSGYSGVASNSGDRGVASNSGKHGVAAGFGLNNKAKSSVTGAIVLVYRNDDDELIHIRSSKVGENGIKPDVWYSLDSDGNFQEVNHV